MGILAWDTILEKTIADLSSFPFSTGATSEGLEGLLSSQDLEDFMQSLPGFLLAFTGEGKLIYVSENVAEHLGHSVVSICPAHQLRETLLSLSCKVEGWSNPLDMHLIMQQPESVLGIIRH